MTSTRVKTSDYSFKNRWNRISKPFSMRRWENNPNTRPKRYGKTFIYYVCDVDGTEFTDRFCPKCGLEAKDFKRFHPI